MTPLINGYRKNQKLRLAITLGAFVLALALLLSYVAVYTVSKYRTGITGYTNFNVSPMHAFLLGDMTSDELQKAWEDKTDDIRLFGTDISLDNISPGMEPRNLPFSLANATSLDKISGVDLNYTLRLRTTANLPLSFTLYSVEVTVLNEGLPNEERSSSILKTFKTSDVYYLDEEAKEGAPKYIYPFYEEISRSSGISYLSNQEYKFEMAGGTIQTQNFILSIEWPIEEGTDADSMKYMKEVDIIDIIANVTSRNKNGTYTVVESNPEFYSDGIVVACPGVGTGKNVGTNKQLFVNNIDYRAFRILSGSGTATQSEYTFYVTNGNNLHRNNTTDVISNNTTQRTTFTLDIAYPLTDDTKSNRSYSVEVSGIFCGSNGIYNPNFRKSALDESSQYSAIYDSSAINASNGIMQIKSSSIEYRLYDIKDWSVNRVFENVDDAYEYIANDDYDYLTDRYRVYAVVTPVGLDGEDLEFELNNRDGLNNIYDWLEFKITMTGSPISGEVAGENIIKVFTNVTYKDGTGLEAYDIPEPVTP